MVPTDSKSTRTGRRIDRVGTPVRKCAGKTHGTDCRDRGSEQLASTRQRILGDISSLRILQRIGILDHARMVCARYGARRHFCRSTCHTR